MQAEIITIGTELLSGQTINTNTVTLSQKLALSGINVNYQSVVGDHQSRLAGCLKTALERSDIVITTGGLGPTVDDITVRTIAETLGQKLILNKQVLTQIKTHFKQKYSKMPASNMRQAYLPEKAEVIENITGTAPGLIIKTSANKYLIALPGVPNEIEHMMKKVNSILKDLYPQKNIIKSRLIKTTGLSESAVNDKIKDLFNLDPHVTLGIYAHPAQIDLRITAQAANEKKADAAILKTETELKKRLKEYVFGAEAQTLESVIGELLIQNNKTISIAESCTGGLISHRLTNTPGSSKYFVLGITAYTNKSKTNELKVQARILKQHGAVSRYTAMAMAEGVEDLTDSQIALGVTGIAGPDTSEKKPVGLVYIALLAHKKQPRQATIRSEKNKQLKVKEFVRHSYSYNFAGDRQTIKYRASQAALDLVRRYLLGYI